MRILLLVLFVCVTLSWSQPEWKLAVSMWEWQRWLSFVEPDSNTTLVGADLSYFPPRVWEEALQICAQHEFICRIETPEDKKNSRIHMIRQECEKRCYVNPYDNAIDRCACYNDDNFKSFVYAQKDVEFWNDIVFKNKDVIPLDLHPGKATVSITRIKNSIIFSYFHNTCATLLQPPFRTVSPDPLTTPYISHW